jgi:DnaJ-domain-containing protein 1
MEENLRKIHLENLLNTLEDADKDKKVEICNIMKEMVKEEIEQAKRNQNNDMTHFLNKLKELLEKTINRYSE